MKKIALTLCVLVALQALSMALEVSIDSSYALIIKDEQLGNLSEFSHLTAVEPPWKQYYFIASQTKGLYIKNTPGNAAVSHAPVAGSKFQLDEYSAVVDNENPNRIFIRCTGHMLENIPGAFEYSAFCLPDEIVSGAKFSAKLTDGSIASGKIAPKAKGMVLAENWTELKMELEYGTLVIKVVKGAPLSLHDRRVNCYYDFRCLWIGAMSVPLTSPFDSEIVFSYFPKGLATLEPLAALNEPFTQSSCEFNDSAFKKKIPTLCIEPKVYEDLGAAADNTAFEVKFSANIPAIDRERLGRALALIEKIPVPVELDLVASEGIFVNSEAFSIERKDGKIILSSAGPRGLRYAIATLKDLDLSRKFILKDWPDLEFRGIHCFTDKELPELGRFLVDEVWTRSRFNHVILECKWCTWDTMKGGWDEKYMDKEELRKFVDYCRDNYIEPIPCVRLFSHAEWLFNNGINQDLRESDKHVYNYDVNNPRTHQVIDALLDEVIDVFKPKYLHVGHDEVDCQNYVEFPSKPENVALGMAELFYRSIMHLHAYLAERGVRTMLWHDAIMSSSETRYGHGMHLDDVKAFRDRLPHDLIVMLWEYSKGMEYHELAKMKSEGFTVIGSPWYDSENIENMTSAAKRDQILGVCGTTWSIYCPGWRLANEYFYELEPHLRVGAKSWGTNKTIPSQHYGDVLAALLRDKGERYSSKLNFSRKAAGGFVIDLSSAANYLLRDNDAILGMTDCKALEHVDRVRVGRGEFKIPYRDGMPAAVMLQSFPLAGRFPESFVVPIGGAANRISLLGALAGGIPAVDKPVLEVVVVYADGTEEPHQLFYNRNVGHFNGVPSADVNAYTSLGVGGGRFGVTEIVPEKTGLKIASIKVISKGQPYLLLGANWER